ncbi:MAG TPA: UTP--glucose-1-phosphate uridylyltransferase GalU [Acidimicrobiales bacterium]|jgi:UTP--glucose-1-phosphate uridylyltransferase
MTSTVRKAVIPAAGLGTRFLPGTKATPKEMLTLVDRPAIQYVVEEAVAAGCTDILVITGRGKRTVEDHFDRTPELEAALSASGKDDLLEEVVRLAGLAHFHFVRQGQALGLGHAVGTARYHIGDEPFVVLLPDDLMHQSSTLLRDMIGAHERTGRSVVALKRFDPPEISLYGVAALAEDPGEEPLVRLRSLVEKPAPEEAPSDLAVMGRYLFTPAIFDLIDGVKPGKGGEIQLTDAMAALAEEGGMDGWVFERGRYDIGAKADFLRASVEFALDRPDLGPDFGAWLGGFVRERGL